jgi:hypothetical protein
MDEWRCSSMRSETQNYMDVSGKVRFPAAEIQGKEHFSLLVQEAVWTEGTSDNGKERNISPLL